MKLIVIAPAVAAYLAGIGTLAGASDTAWDYLVPFEQKQGIRSDYERLWKQKLLLTPGETARFVGLPGNIGVEHAVSIYRKEERKDGLDGGYWMTITQAKSRLWDSIFADGAKAKVDPQDIAVERFDVPLPRLTAQAVRQVWLLMLSEIRPEPETRSVWLDSSTEIFSAEGPEGQMLLGQAPREPGERIIAIVMMANLLIDYCELPIPSRADKAREIEKKASELLRARNSNDKGGRRTVP